MTRNFANITMVLCAIILFNFLNMNDINAATRIEGKLNINTATVSEFTLLPGIGPSKAAAIAAYREGNGSFESLEDLINVKGIGRRTLQKLEKYLKLDGESDLRVVVVMRNPKNSDQDSKKQSSSNN